MRVLLVEDEPLLADFVAKGLREGGHAVDHAANGPDGLHLAQTERYDAWILDRMLPGLEGLELLRRLRAQGHATPALVLSSLGAEGTLYTFKPGSPATALTVIAPTPVAAPW